MDFDLLIVASFLLATLIVGFRSGSQVKNISDYALGGRNFSTATLVATIVATWISGSSFANTLSRTYSDGFYYTIPKYGMVISFIILSYVFIPKMKRLLGKLSIADAMGYIYGDRIRVIVAITGIIASMGMVAVQFKVFGSILSYFLGLSSEQGTLIAASIVTLYSTFGGIRAVTFTDILQMGTFGFIIPMIGVMIWNQAYYDDILFTSFAQNPQFDITSVFVIGNPKLATMIALFCYCALPGMEPTTFQRISMGKNIKQVKRAHLISAAAIFFITLAIQWVPFVLFNVNPDLDRTSLLAYLIDNYTYVGFKGLVISGVIAMAMSTADSQINSCSVLFSHDICNPLGIGIKKELLVSKFFSLFLGVGAIFFALTARDLLDVILMTNAFYMPVVTVPAMLTILGFITSASSIWRGMFAGFGTVVIWKYVGIEADPIAFAMLINLIVILGNHYLFNHGGGWTDIKDETIDPDAKTIPISERIEYLLSPTKWLEYCTKKFPNNELSYVSLGLYFIIYTITTMYSTQGHLAGNSNEKYIWILYQVMMVTGTLLAAYPIWPLRFRGNLRETIAQVLFPIVIFFMLIITSIFFVMLSKFSALQFAVCTVNLLIASMLLGWRLSIAMGAIGFYSSLKLHQLYNPIYQFDIDIGSPAFIMTYLFMLIGASIVLFIKPKQEYIITTEGRVCKLEEDVVFYNGVLNDKEKEIDRLGHTAYKIINNVNHELRLPIGNVVNFSEMLTDSLDKFDSRQVKMISREVYKNSTKLSSMILNMLDLAVLNAQKVELEKTTINLGELVKNCITNSRKIYIGDKQINFKLHIRSEIFAYVDPNYMRQVVDNLVINAISFSESGTIEILLKEHEDEILFSISDEGIGIPEKELHDIFTPFKMASNTESQAKGRGVGLALCKAAIESHGGAIEAKSNGVCGATLRFTLPTDIK